MKSKGLPENNFYRSKWQITTFNINWLLITLSVNENSCCFNQKDNRKGLQTLKISGHNVVVVFMSGVFSKDSLQHFCHIIISSVSLILYA
jgi:hypothetical protein